MDRPLVLDGCCGAGGAARGYAEAGFEVWGVDINPRLERDYLASGAARFICADVLDVLGDREFLRQFHFIHTSFPCQHYSQMSRCRPGLADTYPELITPGRLLLEASGKPFIIENVGAARPWLRDPVCLCGEMFGRKMYRHRLFEAGGGLTLTAPVQPPDPRPGMRKKPNAECGWVHPVAAAKAGHWKPGMYVSVSGHERKEPVREAMGIDWMRDREDVKEAIPPYFARYVGTQLMRQLASR